jgi:protein HOOK3
VRQITNGGPSLRIKIRQLERELGELSIDKSRSESGQTVSSLEGLLRDANKARERYQADYLATRTETIRLEAQLEYIRSGKGEDT